MRQRVAGDGPRTDQNNDGKGVKRAEVPPVENFPGCPGGCLSAVCVPWSSVRVSGSWSCACLVLPGVGCWVAVAGALASSLVVGCCPCLPGSGFCAGFREKGRRPKNRSRRSFARVGLFQVFPGILAVLERRYRGRILTLVHICGFFLPKRLNTLSTHRRGPVEEPPRAEHSQWRFTFPSMSLSRLCFCFYCVVVPTYVMNPSGVRHICHNVISQVSLSRDDVVFAVREVPEEKSHCKFVSLLAANCPTIRK